MSAHRRLVHQRVPGARSTWPASTSTTRSPADARPGPRSRRSRSSCGRSRTTASATACCATWTPRPPRCWRSADSRRSSFNYLGRTGGESGDCRSAGCPAPTRRDRRRLRRRHGALSLDINAVAHRCRTARSPGPTPTQGARRGRGARVGRAVGAGPGRAGHPRRIRRRGWPDTRRTSPLVTVDQRADRTAGSTRFPGLTDVWPLSPLQSGLLFHAQLRRRHRRRLHRADRAAPARRGGRRPGCAAPRRRCWTGTRTCASAFVDDRRRARGWSCSIAPSCRGATSISPDRRRRASERANSTG